LKARRSAHKLVQQEAFARVKSAHNRHHFKAAFQTIEEGQALRHHLQAALAVGPRDLDRPLVSILTRCELRVLLQRP
jgi:hypothetical protein